MGDINNNTSLESDNKNNNANQNTEKFDFGKCKICLDQATGVHYGVASCEGCKVKFKYVKLLTFLS